MTDAEKILIAMGLVNGDIPQNVIDYYLSEWQTVYPDNNCLALYNTIASLYEWLIKSASKNGSGGGKRKEKSGKREIEVDDYNKANDWQKAYDTFLDDPTNSLPSCKDAFKKKGARIYLGGTEKDVYEKIKNDPNSNNQFDERSPYAPRTSNKRVKGFTIYD